MQWYNRLYQVSWGFRCGPESRSGGGPVSQLVVQACQAPATLATSSVSLPPVVVQPGYPLLMNSLCIHRFFFCHTCSLSSPCEAPLVFWGSVWSSIYEQVHVPGGRWPACQSVPCDSVWSSYIKSDTQHVALTSVHAAAYPCLVRWHQQHECDSRQSWQPLVSWC